MAGVGTNYQDWIRQNPQLVGQVAQRFAPPQQQQPATPSVAPIAAPSSSNPYIALNQARGERLATMNQGIDSQNRLGASDEQAAHAQADKLGQFAADSAPVNAAAEATHAANRQQMERLKEERLRLIDELDKPIKGMSGTQKALSLVAGIIGAASQSHGTGTHANPGIGQIGNVLQGFVESSVQKELEDRALLSHRIKARDEAIDMLGRDTDGEIGVAQKLLANRSFLLSKELETIAKHAEGTRYGETARQGALALREKGQGYIEQLAQARVNQLDAQKAAAGKKAAQARLAQMSDMQLRMDGSPEALALLKSRLGTDEQTAGIAKTMAEAGKVKQEGGEAAPPVGWEVERPEVYGALSDPERKEFRAQQAAVDTFKGTLGEIRKILETSGTEAFGKQAGRLQTLIGMATVAYKGAEQLGALDEGTKEISKDIFGDPTAWTKGGESQIAKLDEVIKGSDRKLNNTAKYLGLRSKAAEDELARDVQQGQKVGPPPPPASAPAQPQAPSKIEMVAPNGRVVQLSPEAAQEAHDKGWPTLEEYKALADEQQKEAEYQAQLAANQQAYTEGR